jgi:D-inositol-3-phosphate glycosyltransferase
VTREPLRVLLVSANYRPSVGGIEQYVENLAQGLAQRGHSVTVVACRTDDAAREEQDGSVRIVRLPATDVLDERLNIPYPLPEPVTACRILHRFVAAAHVVHAHDAVYATSLLALALARRRAVTSVLTQHVAFVPQRNRVLDATERAAIATLGRSARLATRVAAYNPAVADWAQATWGLSDVPVLPPGVPDAPEINREEVRRALGLPADRFLALFVGRDVPKKGLDLFLAAGDAAYELVAVTDRPVSTTDGAHILPFVEPGRFREVLAAVDAFVLPSVGEGFPLALQEALVTGLPCIVTPGPGYDHYLREGEAMHVQPEPGEIRRALLRLVGDGSFRKSLASHAREAGHREFDLEQFVDAYEELYRDALGSRCDR